MVMMIFPYEKQKSPPPSHSPPFGQAKKRKGALDHLPIFMKLNTFTIYLLQPQIGFK